MIPTLTRRGEAAQANVLGMALANLAGERLTGLQMAKLERAEQLLAKYRRSLSAFEAGLVRQVCDRFRTSGRHTTVTEHEWHVVDRSIDAMDAALAKRGAA